MRPRLYLSTPITLGNRTMNFATACNTQAELMRLGFAVLNPALTMAHPDAWQIPHDNWMENDLPWVSCADVVLRLPGESKGADLETQHAELKGIPVIHRYHDLLAWKQTWEAAQPRSVANGT